MIKNLSELFSKRLLIVSGKGGVGKTVVSLALALLAVERGKKTLLAEINSEGQVASLLDKKEIGYPEEEILPGLWGVNITPRKSFEEYVLLQIKFKTLYKAIFEHKFVRYFIEATPGLSDLMCIGKVYAASNAYDLVILDAPATGHGISLLKIAAIVSRAVKIGPLKTHSEKIDQLLHDPALTQTILVTLPEEMPVTEALEMGEWLKEARVPLGLLLLNQFHPPPLSPEEERELANSPLSLPVKAMILEKTRAELSRHYLRLLQSKLEDLPLVRLPFLYTTEFKLSAVQKLADILEEAL